MANSKRYNQKTKEKKKLVSEESRLQSGRRESLSCTALEENMMQDAKIKYAEEETEESLKSCQEMHFFLDRLGAGMSKIIYKN